MMKTITFIVVIFILFSCDFGYNYEDEAVFSEWADELAPLTDREKEFIDSISKNVCPIEIKRTFIGRYGYKSVRYDLKLFFDSLTVTPLNRDSIDNLRRDIVNKLYSNIISDSVIYDMDRIHTNIYGVRQERITEKDLSFYEVYLIDSLATWNNFKVVKVAKDRYKRVGW